MIGLFNECFPPVMDGVSLTVSNLARCFYQQGRDVAVVTPEMPGLDESQLPYSVFQYRSFPVPGRHPYRYGFPSLDFKFQKQVAAQNFEILHAHCPFSSGDFALKTARRMGIPLVATFHSKYRDDFERVIPNKALVDYLVGKVVKFYESVDEVWVPQASVGETLREYGYKGTYEVVDNGTELGEECETHHRGFSQGEGFALSRPFRGRWLRKKRNAGNGGKARSVGKRRLPQG